MRIPTVFCFLLLLASCASPPKQSETDDAMRQEILQKQQHVARLEAAMDRQTNVLAQQRKGATGENARRIDELLEQIAQYKKQPKKRFVSFSKPGIYQDYVATCTARIEINGTRSYPPEARGKLYGKGVATFLVARSGDLLEASVDKGTGYPVLDAALLTAIRESAPFPPLPEDTTDPTDVLSITIPYSYEQYDGNHARLFTSKP